MVPGVRGVQIKQHDKDSQYLYNVVSSIALCDWDNVNVHYVISSVNHYVCNLFAFVILLSRLLCNVCTLSACCGIVHTTIIP